MKEFPKNDKQLAGCSLTVCSVQEALRTALENKSACDSVFVLLQCGVESLHDALELKRHFSGILNMTVEVELDHRLENSWRMEACGIFKGKTLFKQGVFSKGVGT